MNSESCSNFISQFKKFKSNSYVIDFDEIICFNKTISNLYSKYTLQIPNMIRPPGIMPVDCWNSYDLKNHPGLIVISNIFTVPFQKFIAWRSLEYYIKKPNKTNLDSSTLNAELLWTDYKKNSHKNSKNIKKLRWATLGYHHDWNLKVYDLSERSDMPIEITRTCEYIASALGYNDYKPEALIVNFYYERNTLSGHTDHSEQDHQSPIISLSFGCSAIFMIGGESKDDRSSALLVNNGDVVVMSGRARMCYHAVPKILLNTFTTPGVNYSIDNMHGLNASAEDDTKIGCNNNKDKNNIKSNVNDDTVDNILFFGDQRINQIGTECDANVLIRGFNCDDSGIIQDGNDRNDGLSSFSFYHRNKCIDKAIENTNVDNKILRNQPISRNNSNRDIDRARIDFRNSKLRILDQINNDLSSEKPLKSEPIILDNNFSCNHTDGEKDKLIGSVDNSQICTDLCHRACDNIYCPVFSEEGDIINEIDEIIKHYLLVDCASKVDRTLNVCNDNLPPDKLNVKNDDDDNNIKCNHFCETSRNAFVDNWDSCNNFLLNSRININVRQVIPNRN